jgi:hypothetical protein
MARQVLVIGVAIMMVCRVATAQEVAVGWEGDDRRGYVFASPSLSVDVGKAQALVFRGAGSYLFYDFPVAGGRVDVASPGVGGALGYRVQSRHVNATLTSGFEMRETRRSEPDATSKTIERGPYAAVELFISAGALTRVSTIANYGRANRYTWARSSVTRQLTNRRFEKARAVGVGLDLTVAGNRDLQTQQLGGVLSWDWFRAKASLQLRAGYSRSLSSGVIVDRYPYVGAGFYRRFEHRRPTAGSS